jgi:hypothetical protein
VLPQTDLRGQHVAHASNGLNTFVRRAIQDRLCETSLIDRE